FSERMFRVVFLGRLTDGASRDAILKPIEKSGRAIHLAEEDIAFIVSASAGYPYFIQFICREVFDLFIQKTEVGEPRVVPVDEIVRKLDTDFFSGRWARATDRQRQLLWVIAQLPNCESEFTAQEVVERSRLAEFKSFSPSHVNQMLATLSEAGLIYKNRRGRYSFAVPLLSGFINRQGPPA
ncbi:MAG: ATP-binding protein, partial [Bacteroidetes bacterium]|nr:ATP-binding protein [Bacteroidota bacterium]